MIKTTIVKAMMKYHHCLLLYHLDQKDVRRTSKNLRILIYSITLCGYTIIKGGKTLLFL